MRMYLVITFLDDENVFNYDVSLDYFWRLDTALDAVNKIQQCSYFLFEDGKERISKNC